jgi:hypothetical protein
MVDDMACPKKGRWAEFQVLHSHFRVHPTAARFVKVLETFGLMRLGQVFRGEFSDLATQNRVKKEGKSVSSPPLFALDQ